MSTSTLRINVAGKTAGLGAMLFEAGWLPCNAACAALDCTPYELDRLVDDGAIQRKSIGPRLYLYDVGRK